MVSIVGANGAGKTTTLKTIMGLLHPGAGEVWFEGERIDGKRTEDIVRRGVAFCMEGRRLFPFMTVLENLQMGAFSRRGGGGKEQLERVYELFPDLRGRLKQKAGTLSGGQQQMVTIGRSLMSGPKLLMLDEPSLGLAPMVVSEVARTVKELNKQGLTVLLVEQNARMALRISDRAYALEVGEVAVRATPSRSARATTSGARTWGARRHRAVPFAGDTWRSCGAGRGAAQDRRAF